MIRKSSFLLNDWFTYAQSVLGADRSLLARRVLLLCCDSLVIVLSFWASFALRLSDLWSVPFQRSLVILPVLLIIGLSVLLFSGWYRSLTRSAGSHSLYSLVPRTAFIVFSLFFFCSISRSLEDPPRSFWFLLWTLMTSGLVLTRVLARDFLRLRLRLSNPSKGLTPTIIYGAGEAGLRLFGDLRQSSEFSVVAFVDDDPALWHRRLHRIQVLPPSDLLIKRQRDDVSHVLLAIPSSSSSRRRELASELGRLGFQVSSIPSLTDIASGKHRVSEIQPVSIEDLLGRDSSIPIPGLLESAAQNRSVLVTGAGGSIGSEICRQVLLLSASKLILVERSEYALYSIYRELIHLYPAEKIVPVLADSCDENLLTQLCKDYSVQLFLHAAAYKHVPLVEANVCTAVANNLNSTASSIGAAVRSNVEHFTLISTDKAVRPTNVMGASKRACELIVQNAASKVKQTGNGPICSIVRFGNVLGSSGSVVPLFKEQIAKGGPVTVTHPHVTRFFMTISEAVQLVLQASSLALGGDVFVLDMGEPVRIADLARQMIELSGFSVLDSDNPAGDISIDFTGLRPGEKLFEELLIGDNVSDTIHPLICRANEDSLGDTYLSSLLVDINQAIYAQDAASVINILSILAPGFRPALAQSSQLANMQNQGS